MKVWKSPEDLPRVIGRGLCDLSSRRIRWGLGVLSCVFRTGCPRLCVLRFKYLVALTRRTVVTATGTGPTNPCPHQATGSILYLSLLTVCLREVFACLADLIDFTVWRLLLFGFILSSILIHTILLLMVFVLSLHCLLDYGLSSVVYLPLHINRFISTICLQRARA